MVDLAYFRLLHSVERLNRAFLEEIKRELDVIGIKDINNVQAVTVFNIGDAELTVREVSTRGFYIGANASYNLKKMLDNGYIVQQPSRYDRRSTRVRLTEKGRALCRQLRALHNRHIETLGKIGISHRDLDSVATTLQAIERMYHETRDRARNLQGE